MEGQPEPRHQPVDVPGGPPARPRPQGEGLSGKPNLLRLLQQGHVLVKHSRRGGPASRAVRLSPDVAPISPQCCLQWASRSKSDEECSIPVTSMVACVAGAHTPVFARSIDPRRRSAASREESSRSFSVVYRPPWPAKRAPPMQQQDEALMGLRAQGWEEVEALAAAEQRPMQLQAGLRTLDLVAPSEDEARAWIKAMRWLINKDQERVEERRQLKREGVRQEGVGDREPFDRPPAYAPPAAAVQQGEAGPGEGEGAYAAAAPPYVPIPDAAAYRPPSPFSPSASLLSPMSSVASPHGPHSPAMFGAGVHMGSPRSGANAVDANGQVAPGSPAPAHLSPPPELHLPSVPACLLLLKEGIPFTDAQLEGDATRMYTLSGDHTALLYTHLVSPAGGMGGEAADLAPAGPNRPSNSLRRIPIASMRDLRIEDAFDALGHFRGSLQCTCMEEEGEEAESQSGDREARAIHVHLTSDNRFLLHLCHKALQYLMQHPPQSPVLEEQSPRVLVPEPQAPRAHAPVFVDAEPEPEPAGAAVALSLPAPSAPSAPSRELPLTPPASRSQFAVASAPALEERPARAAPQSASPARVGLSPSLSLAPPPAAALAPSPPAAAAVPLPVLPNDVPSLIHLACRTELGGIPDWSVNLKIVELVSSFTDAQNDALLSPGGALCSYLRGHDPSSGLLALILFELLYTSLDPFRHTPLLRYDDSWVRKHLVKVLPRWNRKPTESPHPTGLTALFTTRMSDEAMAALMRSQQTRMCLARFNKIKMLISSLATNRRLGSHWLYHYHKLRAAGAYHNPKAFPKAVDADVIVADPTARDAQRLDVSPVERFGDPVVVGAQAKAKAKEQVKAPETPGILGRDAVHFDVRLRHMWAQLSALEALLYSPDGVDAPASPSFADLHASVVANCKSLRQAVRQAAGAGAADQPAPAWLDEGRVAQLFALQDRMTMAAQAGDERRERQEAAQVQARDRLSAEAPADDEHKEEEAKEFSPPPAYVQQQRVYNGAAYVNPYADMHSPLMLQSAPTVPPPYAPRSYLPAAAAVPAPLSPAYSSPSSLPVAPAPAPAPMAAAIPTPLEASPSPVHVASQDAPVAAATPVSMPLQLQDAGEEQKQVSPSYAPVAAAPSSASASPSPSSYLPLQPVPVVLSPSSSLVGVDAYAADFFSRDLMESLHSVPPAADVAPAPAPAPAAAAPQRLGEGGEPEPDAHAHGLEGEQQLASDEGSPAEGSPALASVPLKPAQPVVPNRPAAKQRTAAPRPALLLG